MHADSVSLPKAWPSRAKAAVLQVISVAHFTITYARGWAANSLNARVRQASEIDQLRAEIALLREEVRINDARLATILPQRRPLPPPKNPIPGLWVADSPLRAGIDGRRRRWFRASN